MTSILDHTVSHGRAAVDCKFWLHGFPIPGRAEPLATWAEENGFDGLLLADSQNLVGDPFVELGVIARATSRLGLGTGIINPLTRHPAVVASAMATLSVESDNRAVLGVGRGDSSLAQIGLAPPSTADLAQFVVAIRGFVRGAEVEYRGHRSHLSWIEPGRISPPPVELAATGPRTIALAATISDRLMLTLGADPGRLSAAIALARDARRSAGLDPDSLRVGAYVNVGCADDFATARDMVRGSTAIFAHFLSMSARVSRNLTGSDADVVAAVGSRYDRARHGLTSAGQAGALDDHFIEAFAVVGSASRCTSRLRELVALGLDRIVLVPGSRDTDPDMLLRSNLALAREVLPALRGS